MTRDLWTSQVGFDLRNAAKDAANDDDGVAAADEKDMFEVAGVAAE